MKKKVGAIVLLLIFTSLYSCNKNNVSSPIPNIPFDITLNLSLPLYEPLLFPMGGIVFISGGSKGIAILRVSTDQFVVYDRHCPHKVEEGCVVVEDPDNIAVLIDEGCCTSRFNMINVGLPDNGPAVTALKSYKYNFNGTILRVYN